ncbi:hypothetical protein T459_26647 [Capsicum annuum]|uniref:Germin-like protein n=1 Tax=Capsicum annuum TaxID=4072 RepID=A0A2G2YP71_CAPAN|nr:hypothetical protein T459_26647 [Capsicum annuum]
MAKHFLLLNPVAVLSFRCVVLAFEPSPMQDFCVADPVLHWPTFGWKHIFGSKVTTVNVAQVPRLNILGISLACIDYAPWGATEILTVLEGDVFVFPIGLVHYQRNVGYGNAVAIAALSNQNPGVISIANPVFVSEPAIETYILAKAFQVDDSVASLIQSKL